jgi:transposase
MASIGPLDGGDRRDASSQDVRDRVLSAWERGERPTAIADRFAVSRVWVYQVRNRFTQTGPRGSLPIGGHRRSRVVGMAATLRTWLQETGDLTLAELCTRLAPHGIAITVPALWHPLDKGKLTRKKNPCTPASKHAPTCTPHGVSGKRPTHVGYHEAGVSR